MEDEPTVTKTALFSITAPDGCQLDLVPSQKGQEGWKVDLPGGIAVTCPHGERVTVKVEAEVIVVE